MISVDAYSGKSPVLLAGGFKGGKAQRVVEESCPDHSVANVSGKLLISNVDLVHQARGPQGAE